MRTILTALLLTVLALPAAAAEQVVEISHEEIVMNSVTGETRVFHKVESRTGDLDSIRTSINGSFLWIQFGDNETVSVDVSDTTIVGAAIEDGTVTLMREQVASTPSAPVVRQPVEDEVIDLVTRFPDHDVF